MTTAPDTLKVDPAILDNWRDDSLYDYSRELTQSDFSVWGWLEEHLNELLSSIFGSSFYSKYGAEIWITIGVVLTLMIVGIIIYYRPSLFYNRKTDQLPDTGIEDNIYGFDFNVEIRKAFERKDYRQAVRMVYLQTLRTLSDEALIDWQPFKTPTQYTYEVSSGTFRELTNHFLRVRYGDFPADEELGREMQRLQQLVLQESGLAKGGEA